MNAYSLIMGLLTVIGSLGLFLYGMKEMSEGLQKMAGNKMRSILSRMTSNPVSGVLTGTLVTTAIQSSSATTVMAVSFANAGLLSLSGAIAVVMGANIGTTVTAWIISLFGLKFSIAAFSVPIIAIALPCIFSKKERLQSVGEFIIGFALLFIGMDMLKNSMPDIGAYPNVLAYICQFSNYGYGSYLLFVLIGTLFTIVLQSSSAMMAITLVMCAQGWIGYEVAAAMVLGENIGTTITANIAAAVANTTAKRVARSHFIFNVIGVIWMLIIFVPFLKLISLITIKMDGADPFVSAAAIPIALSLFHSIFNITNTLLQVGFIPKIEKIVSWMVKGAPDEEEEFRLRYIPNGLLSTAELNIQAAASEIDEFSTRVLRMYGMLHTLRNAKSEEEFDKTVSRISKYEEITDHMELEIANFLTHMGGKDLSAEASQRISAMLRIVDNLESIGDSVFHAAMLWKNKRSEAVHFSKELNDNLQKMSILVQHTLDVMDKNLNTDYKMVNLDEAYEAELAVNQYRDELRNKHVKALRNGEYDYSVGTAYSALYALYEKLADYVINVSEAVANKKLTDDRITQ